MSTSSSMIFAGAVFLWLAFGVGVLAGAFSESRSWERRLVDDPAQVAAIRSRVIAERAESESRRAGGGS